MREVSMTEFGRLSVFARLGAVCLLVPLAALPPHRLGSAPLLLVLALAVVASVVSISGRVSEPSIAVAEGLFSAVIAGAMLPESAAVIPYLALPLLVGGLYGRLPGLLRVLVAEVLVTALTWALVLHHVSAAPWRDLLTWLFAGGGMGLLGVYLHSRFFGDGAEASYRDAISLIRQLNALSGKLTGGLDPVALAEQMMTEADIALSVRHAVVFTRTGSGALNPVRYSTFTHPSHFSGIEPWVSAGWGLAHPVVEGTRALVQLRSGRTTVGVLVLDLTKPPDSRTLHRLADQLTGHSLQLHAALLFDQVRAQATSDERNRLAREMHDGVAQDIASLGYLVDTALDGEHDPTQREQLSVVRKEVTRVVAELRASVYDLRHEIRPTQGLGHGLSEYARQVGSRSNLTVHVRLDEGATRLRPEVEAELLRIAQEAMNNARRHSGGTNLWVSCTVRPPYAEIEVLDDGSGLGEPRSDSHGLRIMRERAEQIGATLDVESLGGAPYGTRLRVRLGRL